MKNFLSRRSCMLFTLSIGVCRTFYVKSGRLLVVLFCLLAVPCFAQDRSRLAVFVPMPTGGTLQQRAYFQSNFKMELVGANYPSVDVKTDSAYTLLLDIQDNPDFDSSQPPSDENNSYFLGIKLERTNDNVEIVSFSFPFNDIESMSTWNLYLLYQALSNAYVPEYDIKTPPNNPLDVNILNMPTAAAPAVIDDHWRNQWLYIGGGAGLDMGYFMNGDTNATLGGMAQPVALLSTEIHFLNFLSMEVYPVRIGFLHDGEKAIPALGFGTSLKLVLKPGSYFMLEPYAGMEYNMLLNDAQENFLFALAGMQMGLRGGSRGAITVDFSAAMNLSGKMHFTNGTTGRLVRFSLTAGYKFGFFKR